MNEYRSDRPASGLNGDYQLLGKLDGDRAHVRFSGRFKGRMVLWDCEFVTLHSEYNLLAVNAPVNKRQPVRCFIQIEEPRAERVPIRVGLNIPLIDEPAIMKMLLMIRNYKRLRVGRHEFGERYPSVKDA